MLPAHTPGSIQAEPETEEWKLVLKPGEPANRTCLLLGVILAAAIMSESICTAWKYWLGRRAWLNAIRARCAPLFLARIAEEGSVRQ